MLTLILIFLLIPELYAEEFLSQRTREVEVVFTSHLKDISQEVLTIYPLVRDELETELKLKIDILPMVVLTNRNDFKKIVSSDFIIAFAMPDKKLIVIDTSRVYTKPFTLKTTLQHELCHLLLHRHVEKKNLPRWLDEGICQWVSGGISELMVEHQERTLSKAVVSNRLIDINTLERFPTDEQNLVLAYEESKSLIEFIEKKYGKEGILSMLGYLKEGNSVNESISKALGLTIHELESLWHADLKKKHTWFLYLSNNIYTILFAFATLVMIYGFIRFLKRKREYVDEEQDINDRNIR
ncbi:MAG: hypothetical protein HXY53_09315 [Nitrospirae bacterium]|nr:hypothetical protein [Nitrospirota bacterium]